MIAMFARFFSMITAYFIALENLGKAGVHLTTWAEEGAGAMADEARIQRQYKLNAMLKDTKVTDKQLQVAK